MPLQANDFFNVYNLSVSLDFYYPDIKSKKHSYWDFKHLLTLWERVPKIFTDPDKLHFFTRIFDSFEEHIESEILTLPHSVTHNDINDRNRIVAKTNEEFENNGFRDFSDCVLSPIILTLFFFAHAMLEKSSPIETSVFLLAGYLRVFPMSKRELNLLYYIVLGRLTQLHINSKWTINQTCIDIKHLKLDLTESNHSVSLHIHYQ